MKSKFERKLEKVKELAIKENVPIIMDETLQKIKATLKELNKNTINKILEIGTATGYSALCFSELLTDNGEIDTIERDEERIAKAKENIKILEGNKKINLYEGMVVGINSRNEDLTINVCKEKHLTNTRSSGADDALRLVPPKKMSLEESIEFIAEDELVEVTPENIRIRKKTLDTKTRERESRRASN